jgi:hypothetical protein
MGSMSKVFMLLSSKYTSHTTFPLIIFNDPPPDMLTPHTHTHDYCDAVISTRVCACGGKLSPSAVFGRCGGEYLKTVG